MAVSPPPPNQGLPDWTQFPDDYPQVLDVAGELLALAAAQLDPPAGAAVIWPGSEVAWDVPAGGLLYVVVRSQVPHGDPKCWDQFSTANIVLGCLRCIDAMQSDGSAPPWEQRTTDGVQILLDSQALLQAALAMPSEYTVVNPNWSSLGPQGGVAGGEWTLPFTTVA